MVIRCYVYGFDIANDYFDFFLGMATLTQTILKEFELNWGDLESIHLRNITDCCTHFIIMCSLGFLTNLSSIVDSV